MQMDETDERGSEDPNSGMVVYVDEADRHLPVANISRIMKKVLPTNAQVSKVSLGHYYL